VASAIFYVPALGDEAKASADRLEEEMKSELGDQRWPLMEAQWNSHGTHTLRRILDLDSAQEPQECLRLARYEQRRRSHSRLSVASRTKCLQLGWLGSGGHVAGRTTQDGTVAHQ